MRSAPTRTRRTPPRRSRRPRTIQKQRLQPSDAISSEHLAHAATPSPPARQCTPIASGRETGTHTALSSATREVVIGHDQPFCIIGERINPTGRRIFQEQLRAGDLSAIERDVAAQVAGGANVLDVNMGVPLTDEPELLNKAIQLIQSSPTCRSASTPRSSRRSRPAWRRTRAGPWSTRSPPRTTGWLRSCRWSRRYGAAVIALPNDARRDPDGGRQAARPDRGRSSTSRPTSTASPVEDIVIDPLAMPIGADPTIVNDRVRDDRTGSGTSSAST